MHAGKIHFFAGHSPAQWRIEGEELQRGAIMSASPQQAREIFVAAVKLVPDLWDAYLKEACGDDAALRDRVHNLLVAHKEAGSFLEPAVAALAVTNEELVSERPGTAIGSYKLLQQIGEGGMGTVFMAEQTQPVHRKVALKVIKPGMDSRQVIARFEAERQALAMMDHVNIARVFDGGTTANGGPYFVMELVHGVPITKYCDDNQLTPRERLELFVPVCQAIQHAHQKGIIHRDIKPSNVMITLYDGKPVPKVIDFGIAKATEQKLTARTLFTQYGAMVGTLEYMSPEQAEMSALGIDTRSDIYSLGVLLYELLTGSTPLSHKRVKDATHAEILRLIKEEESPKPSTRLSDSEEALASISAQRKTEPAKLSKLMRGELDWIVMKTLEKDRNRRYDTASAFAGDVQRYLNDETVQACPPSAWYRFRKLARRNKVGVLTSVGIALGVLLAVGSALVVQVANNVQIKAEQMQTNEALAREKQTNEAHVQSLARERQTLYFQRLGLVQRDLVLNKIGTAEELLHECPEGLRGWEWRLLKRQPYEAPLVLPTGKVWVMHLACSDDGRYLATGSFDSAMRLEVKLRDAATCKELHTLPGLAVAFQPGGGQLATTADDDKVRLWDAATAKLLRILEGDGGTVISLSYRPDGNRLASASLDGKVRVWDLATGAEVLRFGGQAKPVLRLAYSPDGRRIASWGVDTYIRVWDADSGAEQQQLAGHWHGVISLVFHKDGRHVVSAGSDGRRFWDLQTGQLERTFRGINSATFMATFNPDGDRLVFAGCDKTVQVWDWPSGQEVLALRGHTDVVTAVAFSANGRRLFSASPDGTIRVWDGTPLAQSTPLRHRPLQGHEGPVVGLAFSPDGRYLATGALDSTARLWDVAARKLVHTLHGQDVPSVAFHAGGRRLTTVATDGTLAQWDPATGQRQRTLRGHLGPIWNASMGVGFSADGERLTTLSKGGAIPVWETDSGREVVRIPPPGVVNTAFLSPDGRRVAVAGMGSVQILDVESQKRLAGWSTTFHIIYHLAFSADGQRIAAAFADGTVRVWEIHSEKLLHTFRHGDPVNCVAFHPNGKQLASGSCDNTAKIWDLDTDEEVETLRGHIGYVTTLAYSHDGKLLATASGHRYAGEVQLWETAAFGKNR
jgi:eukaryotic-like serine/threonine-protein kinase